MHSLIAHPVAPATKHLPAPRRRAGAVLTLLVTAAVAWPLGLFATANYVYHERTGADPGCGGQYVTRLNPSSAQTHPLRFKVEFQFFTDTTSVYYTTDGSTPLGAYGNPSNTTQIAAGSFVCTFGGPVVDEWEATIPAQAAGTVVKYIIGAWHSGGGMEVFANGGTCGGCGDTTNSASATAFQYTVGSTTDLYWDANGATAGAGGATPAGIWGTDNFWSGVLDGTADTEAWTAGRTAVFSAGADASGAFIVTLGGPQTAGSLVFEEGAVTLSGATPATNLTWNGPVMVAGGASAAVNALLSGSGGLVKSGAGLLTLGATNDFSGNLSVAAGTVAFSADTHLGPVPSAFNQTAVALQDGTTLRLNAGVITFAANRGLTIAGSGANLEAVAPAILFIPNVVDGPGTTVTKTGSGEVGFYGAANTFAKLVIDQGNLRIGQATFAGSDLSYGAVPAVFTPDAIVIRNGATNRVVGSTAVAISANRGITLGAGGGVFRNDVSPVSLTINSTISGPGGLRKEGGQAFIVNGARSHDGPTVINGGGISLTAPQNTFNGQGTGTGALLMNSGRLFLNHANAFSSVGVSGGRIDVNTNGCLGAGTVTVSPTNSVTIVNATILVPTNVALLNDFVLNSGTSLAGASVIIDIAANSGRELVLNGKVSGNAHWKKDNAGTGTLVLGNSANDFTGTLTNVGGTLIAAANNALGSISGGTVINNASSLAFRGGVDYSAAEPVTITGMGRLGFGAISNDSGNCSFAGPITMSGNSGFGGLPGATLSLGGVIDETGGARAFAKLTPNTIRLTAANLYSGGTLISNGTLVVANTTGSATGPGPITIFPGGSLSGPGSVAGDLTINGVLSPGASPGTLNTGNETWNGGGSYLWEINDAAGTTGADPGWDLANITGTLTIGATSGSKFTIDITSLTAGNVAGDAVNFDNTLDYIWTIATASGGITGFDPAAFNVVSTGFSNPRGNGVFLVEQSGNDIRVRFARTPAIAMQPVDASAECGSGSAMFSVTATGTAPLSYQWRHNGADLGGATMASLALNNVSSLQAGSYDCVVTNLYGSVTSLVATLHVLDTTMPVITNCATNQIIAADASCQGVIPDLLPQVVAGDACSAVTLSQNPAAGTIVPLGATNVTISATDSSNNVATCVAVITVTDQTAPVITNCAPNLTVCTNSGSSAALPNFAPQVIAGDNCSSVTVTQSPLAGTLVLAGDSTNVTLHAADTSGNVSTCLAVFTVHVSTTVSALAPVNNACPGTTATFGPVTAGGTGPFSYAWTSNGVLLAGENGTSLSVPSITASSAVTYCVIVTGACNSVTNCTTLTVAAPPTFTVQPQNQTTPMGNGAVFTSTATSPVAVTYQWQTNGVDVAGATAGSLAISNLPLALNGTLVRVIASTCGGSATSQVATLTVTPISGISFDFNTPGQYTNAPYNLVGSDWHNNAIVNALPFGPIVPWESPTGGVGVAGSGALDLIFNNGTDQSSTLTPVTYDFSLPGKTLTASIMVQLKTPVANQRAIQIGFITQTNGADSLGKLTTAGINATANLGWMSAIFQSVTNGRPSTISYHLRGQHKVIAGTTAIETQPLNSPTNTFLPGTGTNRWYKYVAKFVNVKGAGNSASNYTVESTIQDMGADGVTPGIIVLGMPSLLQTNVDIVNQRNLYLSIRCFENGGNDFFDNIYVTTASGDVAIVQDLPNPTVPQGRVTTFRTLVDGDGPYTYQWFKNGVPIAGAGNWKYTTPALLLSDDQAEFSVTVTGPNNSVSSTGTVTVTSETLDVVSVGSVDGGVIGLRFDQPVDKTSAETAGNYLVNGVPAAGAQLRSFANDFQKYRTNGTEVLITPATAVAGAFTVTVSGVTSLSGTPLGVNSAAGAVAGLIGFDVDANDQINGQGYQGLVNFPPVATYPGENFSFAPGSFEITGGGHDIFGAFDGFRYVYRQVTGDFDVKMRIPYIDLVRTPTKAGFDARMTLDATSPHVGTYANPALPGRNFIEGGQRTNFWGTTVSWGQQPTNFFPNVWLRFRRAGNTFMRYHSTNGVNWNLNGQVVAGNPSFPPTIYLGLAVCANVGQSVLQQPATAQIDSYGDFAGYPGATIAITTQPVNQTVNAGAAATFSLAANVTGGGIPAGGELSFIWQRDAGGGNWTNMPSAGQTNASLVTGTLYRSDNGALFRVIVRAPGATDVTSATVSVTVNDAAGPTLVSASSAPGRPDTLLLVFNEPLSATALNTANYTVTNANGSVVTVTGASFVNGNLATVLLTLSGAQGGRLGVALNGLQDLNLNNVAANAGTNFASQAVPTGPIVIEWYGGTPTAGNMADLTNYWKFTSNNPDFIMYSNAFAFNGGAHIPTGPDNYGQKVYTYFVPPTNGAYKFWLRGDDFLSLSINTNAVGSTNPAAMATNVINMTANNPLFVVANSYTSVVLNAGQPYYMQVNFKEGGGGDGMQLGISAAGDTTVPSTNILAAGMFAYPGAIAPRIVAQVEIYTNLFNTGANNNAGQPDNNLVALSNALLSAKMLGQAPDYLAYNKYLGCASNKVSTSLEHYVGRVFSYYIPPASGNYRFYTFSDDASQVLMNTNAVGDTKDPAGATVIGGVTANVGAYTLVGQNVTLVGGQRYYIEGRWKEGTGGDGMWIAVRPQADAVVPALGSVGIDPLQLEFPTNLATTVSVPRSYVTPINPTINEGEIVTFYGAGFGNSYQWLKNGELVYVSTNAPTPVSYHTPPLTSADDQAIFTLLMTNSFGTAMATSRVTVLADVTAPTIVSAVASQYGNSVLVTFSENVTGFTAQQLANYSIPGLQILAADFDDLTRRRVSLRTAPQTPNTGYTLSITGVRDASSVGNTMLNVSKSFTSWGFGGLGGVLVELWTNMQSASVDFFEADPRYINNQPDVSFYTNAFGIDAFQGQSGLEFYAGRISGCFMPPSNGLYRFFVRGDDNSKLYMNTNGPSPAGKVQLARNDAANSAAYNTGLGLGYVGASQSPIISLTNGTAYYMEALFKEGTGGDYLEVVMRAIDPGTGLEIGGVPAPAAGNTLSGGFFCAPGNPDVNKLLVLAAPPASLSVAEGDPIALGISTTVIPASLQQFASYQWQRSNSMSGTFTNIPGAVGLTYNFFARLDDNDGAYRVVAGIPGTNVALTTLMSVVADTTPPYIASAGSIDGWVVGIRFNELVDTNLALDNFTYLINGDANIGITAVSNAPSRDGRSFLLFLNTQLTGPYSVEISDQTFNGPIADLAVSPNYGYSTNYGQIEGFTNLDVGAPTMIGSTLSFQSNNVEVIAGGADIWGASDSGHLSLKQRTGDFDVKARVGRLTRSGTDIIAKAGLMVRETLEANSRTLHQLVNPPAAIGGRDIYETGRRETPGNVTAAWNLGTHGGNNGTPAGVSNAWVRIKRTGNLFVAYRSSNNVDWVATSTNTLTFSNTVYVGLASTAHNNAGPAINADYADIYIPNPPSITLQPSPGIQVVAVHGAVSYMVAASNPADSGPLTYQWKLDGFNIPGANSATYSIADAGKANQGVITCFVGNDGGQTISDAVTLLVDNMPPMVGNDTLQATQDVARTVSSATLLANDSDPEDGPAIGIYVVSGMPPVSVVTNFSEGKPLEAALYGSAAIPDGVLHLTDAVNDQAGSMVVSNAYPTKRVSAFTASFKIRIAQGTAQPADGFSFNFANDIPNAAGGGENGIGTGFSFCIDNYQFANYPVGGVANTSGMKVRYNNVDLAGVQIPTWGYGDFIPVSITVTPAGGCSILVNNTNAFTLALPGYAPALGRFGLFARNGNQNQAHWIDDLNISYVTADTVAGGQVSESGGTVTYTPPANVCGADAFYYLATEGQLNSFSVAQVDVTIGETMAEPPVFTVCPTNRIIIITGNCNPPLADLRGEAAATDNCGTPVITQSPLPGAALNIGANVITLTAMDQAGNSTNCTAVVTVLDQTAPVIVCSPNVMVECTGPAGAVATYSTTASDFCDPSPTVVCSPPSGSIFPLGVTTVNCAAYDASLNTNVCSFTVTVQDTAAPVVVCPTNMVVTLAAGLCATNVSFPAPGLTDCDTNAAYVFDPPSGSVLPAGSNVVTVIAYDTHGHTNQCTFIVAVLESVKPSMVCPPDLIVDCGDPTMPPATGTATATDNCDTNVVVTFADGSTVESLGDGTNGWVFSATGDPLTASAGITAGPSAPPLGTGSLRLAIGSDGDNVAQARNTNYHNVPLAAVSELAFRTYRTAGGVNQSIYLILNVDLDGDALLDDLLFFEPRYQDGDNPMLPNQGTLAAGTWQSWNAMIGGWHSLNHPGLMSAGPGVQPLATYVAAFPTAKIVNTTSGAGGVRLVAGLGLGGWANFDGSVDQVALGVNGLSQVHDFDDVAGNDPLVSQIVRTWTAMDDSGNLLSCSQVIKVRDITGPVMACSTNIIAECNAPGGATVNYVTTATDACDGPVTPVCTPVSGSYFAMGLNTVNCHAVDAHGNSNSCSFTITVQDTSPPAIVCSTNRVVECAGGMGTPVSYVTTATDVCDTNLLVVCTPASGSPFPLGTTTVGCSVADVSGNTNGCSFTVTVQDTTPPVIVCSSNLVVECTSPAGAVAAYMTTASDVCDTVPALVCAPVSGSTFPPGLTTVHCLATDASGNSNACSFTISVVDTTPPAIVCSTNITIEATSHAGAVAAYTVTTSDLCDTNPALVCAPLSGSTFPLGATTVNCVSTDASGNSNACSFTVTVTDTTPPVITCPANIVVECGTPAGTLVNFTVTATDIADPGPVITSTPPSGSVFPPGVTTVTNVARDASGNSNVCTFTVTVQDTTPPVRCANPPVIVMGGVNDGFIGVEPASPSANLQARLSSVDLRNFDEAVADGWLGHSFGALPNYIAEAKLRIKLRADFGVPENDTIQLLFTGPGGSAQPQEWTRRIGSGFDATPGVLPVTWSLGAETELVLNLSRLTNANATVTDLMPQLRMLRYLDLIVQDDTLVDYVVLELTVCQCQPDLVVNKDPMGCGATVTFPLPPFADNCDSNPAVLCAPASGSFFPVGATLVTCTATDFSGNSAVCTFNVTVQDASAPLTIAQSGANVIISWPTTCSPAVLEETGDLTAPISWVPVGAPVVNVGPQSQVTLPATGPQRYFRLRQ